MRVFLNELALADAWTSAASVERPLRAILQARLTQPVLRNALYCARATPGVETPAGVPLHLAAKQLPRDTRVQLYDWMSKHGPFIDDDRQDIDQDLFFFEDDEVTELGLGEAARRIRAKSRAAVLSPATGARSRFAPDPLAVVQGFADEPVARVAVPNHTEPESVVAVLRTLDPGAANWEAFLADCRQRFHRLHIGPHCDDTIGHFPYMPAAARRIVQLLDVLQRIKAEMNDAGGLSPAGVALRNDHFTGDRAWFSDESERRKQQPGRFTFPDPAGGPAIVCFWHGKVATADIRLYFDWPVESASQRLRVTYIGPHL